MIVSIMQPYFFPYIGYFQLIAQSDLFVLHDDAQHIKGGWVNRNRILRDGKACWFTLPVAHAPHQLAINQRTYELNARNVRRLTRQIESSYRKAPHFERVYPLVRDALSFSDANIAAYNTNLLTRITAELQLKTRFVRSSEMAGANRYTGQDKVIDLCQCVGATRYVNAIGGTELYEQAAFARAGLDLAFLESTASTYPQFGGTPVPGLSIIDVLMFNDPPTIAAMLQQYRRLAPADARMRVA